MKKILVVLFIAMSWGVYAQDTAMLKVHVQAEDLSPLTGEQIIFEAQNGSYSVKGVSDADGLVTVALLGGQKYNIMLKAVGEAKNFNTIEIPALEPNTAYGVNEMTITVYPPKNFTLDNVLFETGKSILKTSSKAELNELVEYLSLKEDLRILISGHTDNVGDAEKNMLLSQDRALAVKKYLVANGINAARLETAGFGDRQPVADNNTAEGRKLNRRTAVSIIE